MKKYSTVVAAVALVATAGCDDFLTGPGLTDNPNFPITASAEQLLVGIQGRGFVQQEGQLARTASIWTQQLGGINNQQRDYGSRYDFRELDLNTFFNGVYSQGGLVDQRRLQDAAATAGDARLAGIAKIWEGLNIGTAASLWGNIPYREAVSGQPAPKIDPQQQVYADVQALLADAIGQLANAPSTPALGADLIYNGNTARWRAAANTLKARYYLHVAPREGAAAYQAALNAANQGINEAPANATQAMHGQAPGDFRAWHGSTLDDGNIWAQFLEARSDIVANGRMVRILQQRNDPRLAAYFDPVTHQGTSQYRGADQFGVGGEPWSPLSATRRARTFRQPIVTWAENQLIKAEANYRLGNPSAALTNLNSVRQAVGLAALPATLAGERLFEEIMVEKWIVQFQNIDAYADWRRTCYPRLIPGGPNRPTPAARVPGRYVYGQTERQQNPNFASLAPAQQPADNWATEVTQPCPTSGGTAYPTP